MYTIVGGSQNPLKLRRVLWSVGRMPTTTNFEGGRATGEVCSTRSLDKRLPYLEVSRLICISSLVVECGPSKAKVRVRFPRDANFFFQNSVSCSSSV